MKVKDLLRFIPSETEIKILQTPIPIIDRSGLPIERYLGTASIAIASKQNYLEFDVVEVRPSSDLCIVLCKPTTEQEKRIIRAYYSKA